MSDQSILRRAVQRLLFRKYQAHHHAAVRKFEADIWNKRQNDPKFTTAEAKAERYKKDCFEALIVACKNDKSVNEYTLPREFDKIYSELQSSPEKQQNPEKTTGTKRQIQFIGKNEPAPKRPKKTDANNTLIGSNVKKWRVAIEKF